MEPQARSLSEEEQTLLAQIDRGIDWHKKRADALFRRHRVMRLVQVFVATGLLLVTLLPLSIDFLKLYSGVTAFVIIFTTCWLEFLTVREPVFEYRRISQKLAELKFCYLSRMAPYAQEGERQILLAEHMAEILYKDIGPRGTSKFRLPEGILPNSKEKF